MKTKLILILLLICTTSNLYAAVETTFKATMTIDKLNNTKSPVVVPLTKVGKITLPSSVSVWDCSVIERFMSDDGQSLYQNISCTHNSAMIVIEATCNMFVANSNSDNVRLSATDSDTFVVLEIQCTTK